MSPADAAAPPLSKPLRLWPGVVAAVVGWLAFLLSPIFPPGPLPFGLIGWLVGGLAIVLWWLFWSRAPWPERVGVVVLMALGAFVTSRLAHISLQNAGQGRLIYILCLPILTLGLVAGALAGRRLERGPRRVSLVAAILLACLVLALGRIDGVGGGALVDWEWRWTPTAEDRLLAQADDERARLATAPKSADRAPVSVETAPDGADPAPVIADAADVGVARGDRQGQDRAAVDAEPGGPSAPARTGARPDWPGFRGPRRDGVVRGVRIATDWSQSPPVEMWRRAVGPGWSSFAVDGDRFYTQEQLGEEELVSCYHLESGEPVWRHADRARFWEANGGAGPRATPTLHDGRVYTFGGTGILNALDAADGTVIWSRPSDTGRKPYWGFSSSPLVVGDLVVVAAAGTLAAYDLATGEPRWLGAEGKCCYSSPHLATIDDVPQILLMNGAGVISVSPTDGTLLWEHEYKGDGIVQPALTEDGDVLIGGAGMGGSNGLRRLDVSRASEDWSAERGAGGWTVEERWTSNGLKPFFNDFVVHEGHAYGFDGSILSCIGLEDGKRRWKGGRYGDGQLVLLADQHLLLVLSETGELALVDATPGQFSERARFEAIESKTWNHPVVVRDVVLVRNSEEMAAFRLPPAGP
jgi:outer membrane protein assembly factor BamB